MFGVIDDESEPGSWAREIDMKQAMGNDAVERPSHYNQGGIEAIEAIKASMSREEFEGYLKGNCMKYLWRYRYKGKPAQDLRKARWYIDRLLAELDD